MKIRISFELIYDDPAYVEEYNELVETIKSEILSMDVPQTEYIWWQSMKNLKIESDYKEKKDNNDRDSM